MAPAAWTPVGLHHHQSSSSTTSSDRNSSASFGDFGSNSQQSRYSNVPADALKKELSATLSSGSVSGGIKKPTIIRPASKVTATQASSLSTVTAAGDAGAVAAAASRFSSRALMNSIKSQSVEQAVQQSERSSPQQRNYYDVPPDEEDDDFDDEANDSSLMASPPMPSEPPPPPPADLAVDEWVDSTTRVTDYPDTYSDAGQVLIMQLVTKILVDSFNCNFEVGLLILVICVFLGYSICHRIVRLCS